MFQKRILVSYCIKLQSKTIHRKFDKNCFQAILILLIFFINSHARTLIQSLRILFVQCSVILFTARLMKNSDINTITLIYKTIQAYSLIKIQVSVIYRLLNTRFNQHLRTHTLYIFHSPLFSFLSPRARAYTEEEVEGYVNIYYINI